MATQTLNQADNPRRPAPSAPPGGDKTPAASSQSSPMPGTTAEVSSHRWWIMLGLIMVAALEI